MSMSSPENSLKLLSQANPNAAEIPGVGPGNRFDHELQIYVPDEGSVYTNGHQITPLSQIEIQGGE